MSKSTGCKNVSKGGMVKNTEAKKRLLNLFLLLFIPGFVMVDAWFGLLVAKFVIATPLEPPYVEFIAVYISWVLLIIGIVLISVSIYIYMQRRRIC